MNVLMILCVGYFALALVCAAVWTTWRGQGWWWALKRRTRQVLAISLVMSCGFGVWAAVTMDERVEPTFDHLTDYVWPSVPLAVTWNPAELDGYNDGIQEAMRLWNSEVGCTLFIPAPSSMPFQARIKAFDGAPCGKEFRDLHGSDNFDAADGAWDCHDGTVEVQVKNMGDVLTGYRVFVHGLGHVLRLAHDPTGVMAAVVKPMSVILPNRKDLAALRARYCHQPGSEPARN